LFQGSSYDVHEDASGSLSKLPDYLFEVLTILDRMKEWLISETPITWYYQTLSKRSVEDEWGNFIVDQRVFTRGDATDTSSNTFPAIIYQTIPEIRLYRYLAAEMPVDFACLDLDQDWREFGFDPPPGAAERLSFRRYFDVYLGIAPVGSSGRPGLVF